MSDFPGSLNNAVVSLSESLTPEGVRGVIAREWTFEVVRDIGNRVVAAMAKGAMGVSSDGAGVLVGYDTRFLSDAYAETLAEVLVTRVPVSVVSEPVSLPHLSYRIREGGFDAGLYVTGGILPPDYSGVCFLGSDGAYLPQATLKTIFASEVSGEPKAGGEPPGRKIAYMGPRSGYGEALLTGASLRSALGWRREILIDVNYGPTESDLMSALSRTGLYFRTVKTERDVLFGGRTPDLPHQAPPVDPGRTDTPFLALAVDPTGQRLAATDTGSGWVPPEILLPCLLQDLVRREGSPCTVVRTQATTHWVEAVLAGAGARIVECAPGPANLSRAVISEHARWGIDESGCLIDAEHLLVPDGVRAGIALLTVLSETDGNLSQWIKGKVTQSPPPVRRILELRLDPLSIGALLQAVRRSPMLRWQDYPLVKATDQYGIKFVFQGGRWVYFCPRFPESRLDLVFETPDPEEADPMEKQLLEMSHLAGVMKV